MELSFVKMEGCGNDYIYFDCFGQEVPNPEALSVAVSDRHFGIGGDGLVLIEPSGLADARMRMFNLDGSEGAMCGNAVRCVGKYLYESGRARRNPLRVETGSGVKELELLLKGEQVRGARVAMGAPEFAPEKIPVKLPGHRIVNREVEIGGRRFRVTCLSMGNPHCVVFLDGVEELELGRIGPLFERADIFPRRINTEFVQAVGKRTLHMRVWERGSGETLACGTGACAAAVAAVENGICPAGEEIHVELRGGALDIRYRDGEVIMTGPARRVFRGTLELF